MMDGSSSSDEKKVYDIEAKLSDVEANAFPVEEIIQKDKLKFVDRIGLLFNAEIRGIERVPVEERTDTSVLTSGTMWASVNMCVAALSTGALGPGAFGLGWYDSCACIIVMVFVGSLPVALYSMLCANFGLRQMMMTRFFAGNITARLYSILNIISCVGWSAVNQLLAVQLLHIVNNQKLPPWAGCLILSVLTTVLALFGYDIIHKYDKYSWIPTCAVFFVIVARLAINDQFYNAPMPSGPVEAGNVLTFMSLVWGFAAGWSPSAGDYVVYKDPKIKGYKIFIAVYIGMVIPCLFSMLLGAAVATGIQKDPKLAALWDSDSIGGLIYGVIAQDSLHGFGQFCCVILALATIAGNIPSAYSLSICAPAVWSKFAKLPRIFWCLLGNCIALGLSIPAYYVFVTAMSNFLDMISYFVSIYIGSTMAEHLIFRKNNVHNYAPEDYLDRNKLPIGYAGLFAFACGVAGAVVGMDESWYSGPIAIKIGEGGDVGWLLGMGFAFIGHCLIRPLELKYTGR